MLHPGTIGLMMAIMLIAGASVNAQRALLKPAPSDLHEVLPAPQDWVEDHPLVIRRGLLSIDVEALDAVLQDSRAGESIVSIALFNDVAYKAIFDSGYSDDYGFRISGSLEDQAFGSIVLAVQGTTVSGTVRTASEIFQIRTLTDNTYIVTQMNPAEFAREAEPSRQTTRPNPDPPSRDGGSTIDMLVAYTTAALELEGGRQQMETLIGSLEEETNRAFTQSGVQARLRVVGVTEVDFQRTDPQDDELAFAISGTLCNLSFAHEIGHLMGLDHDLYSINIRRRGPRGAFSFSHGYVNPAELWRTIMAYPDACQPVHCPRLPIFSNPRRSHPNTGSPLGDPVAADAARSLNQTIHHVASFR